MIILISYPKSFEFKELVSLWIRRHDLICRNEANKLAPEERRAKKIDKWKNIKEHEGCTVLLFKVLFCRSMNEFDA